MRELTADLEAIGSDARVRAIILRANGPVFSAGHDLSELVGRDAAAYQEIFDACVRLMETIQQVPQPVIAEVAGVATAAGCQLVATCDLAVAAEGARFATPGVKIGLFCSTPMVAVSRAIGRKRAMQMLLTGELIDAATAAEWGLVNQVVPPDQLAVATRALAEKIAGTSPYTVRIGKQAFYRQIDLPQHEAYEYTRAVMVENAQAADAQEGMGAFLEKRPPTWTGR
jgi:enoyl-CoA hydratase/carnithine racemase